MQIESTSDDPLNVLDRASWSRWLKSGVARISGMPKRLSGESLAEAKEEVARLKEQIEAEERRRSVPFSEAFWD